MVLAAETDDTRQAITFLILGLVVIALTLTLLTIWYWRLTSPKRSAALLFDGEMDPVHPQHGPAFEAIPAATKAVAPDPATPLPTQQKASALTPAAVVADPPTGATTTAQAERAKVLADEVAEARRRPAPQRPNPQRPGSRPTGHHAPEARGIASSSPPSSSSPSPVAAVDRLDRPRKRMGTRDEVAEARLRRDRREGVLSDDDWAAVRKSVFDQLDP